MKSVCLLSRQWREFYSRLPESCIDAILRPDFYSHFGSDPTYSAGFNATVSNITEIGLSFGGGRFFENGVGTTDGSGTFALNSYMAS